MIKEIPEPRTAPVSRLAVGENRALKRYVFVLEKTLGHISHAKNLERTLARRTDLDATLIHLDPAQSRTLDRLPAFRNWSLRASWSARWGVRGLLRGSGADVLYIHTQVAALLLVRTMHKVPAVISLDATPVNIDSVAEPYGHHRGGDTFEWVKLQLYARAFSAARALVTFSRWAARSLVDDYRVPAEKVRVIPQGVDLDLFRPAARRMPGAKARILFVGGDFIRKGGSDLLEAVRGIGDRAELDVVTGAGGWSPPPEIRCWVHTGVRPQSPRLVELFQRADVFVLPTRADCSPNVVAEALGAGLPIVATRIGGIPELVREGVNGRLVPAGSPRDLARAIESLVDEPRLRMTMGAESRRLAEREHDAARNCQAVLDVMAAVSEPA